ncbi:toll/interleukin-1 receptor domain-containing protein [Leptospira sarikeiensis]|uniref:Toll/interleukin-1 receptor domain-containing protein n=1 Tax=Leptospira sarikeiensis TaxID=2484943 RepID=A0A4R9K3G7_9LEPT|nr:toll/interleukin-1 receptor domain-containing protein [Leptospira sarikeiensis]TGL60041.1 toll/interleukin-1 receptor domain-containing protein [Leptospira sarikeiensis]
MPVFISYSRTDLDFVDRLAKNLVSERVHVWLDRWEMKVGDSLIDKIQSAIKSSDYLCVVLSKASVSSDWCRKELNSALMRELEEKRVVVLPVLLEDCEIPFFLKEKFYADFRNSFQSGFQDLKNALAHAATSSLGRFESADSDTDWGIDWGLFNGKFFFVRMTAVHIYKNYPFTLLAEIQLTCNDKATLRNQYFESAGLGWFHRETILEILWEFEEIRNLRILIEDNLPKQVVTVFKDANSKQEITISLSIRRLGMDTGQDTLYDFDFLIDGIRDDRENRVQQPTEEEKKKIIELIKRNPHGV